MRVSTVLLFSHNQQHKDPVNECPPEFSTRYVSTVDECYYELFKNKNPTFDAIFIESAELTPTLRNLMECIETHSISKNLYFVSNSKAQIDSIAKAWTLTDSLLNSYRAANHALAKNRNPKRKENTAPSKNTDKFIQDLQNEYEVLLQCAGEGIIGLDGNGIITFANKTASELLGNPIESLLNQPFTNYSIDSPLRMGSNTSSFTVNNTSRRRVGRGAISRPDGSQIYVEYTQSFVGNMKSNTVSIMVIEDISERIKFETKLMKLAYTDNLTGLHNRYYFEKTLNNELRNRRSHNHTLILALIDLDGFKQINDTFGHMTGDKLLVLVGKRISDCIRRSDLLARLGGDEFCLLFKDIDMASAKHLLDKILFQLSLPFQIGEHTIQISGSIGFCESKSNFDELCTLLYEADQAMYTVKSSGRNGIANARACHPTECPTNSFQVDQAHTDCDRS